MATYITFRRDTLPTTDQKMASETWFNMWRLKRWPYDLLEVGDLLFFYEAPSKSIVWKTQITEIGRLRYNDKREAESWLKEKFGGYTKGAAYFSRAGRTGVCLAWKIHPLERLDLPRPDGIKFRQQGWLEGELAISQGWPLPIAS